MKLESGQQLSHFRLVAKIGEGGMGVVYRARDEKLRRDVAVKVLPPGLIDDHERRARFLREARAAAAVAHPNIATIYEVDQIDDVLFLAMELVEGATLRSILQGEPLPIPDALHYAGGIAEGLARAHQAKIVHRDLKPENIMITKDGQPKILDFGLAKLVAGRNPGSRTAAEVSAVETATRSVTQAGRVLGTVTYMSPEQARGDRVDARSDVFSFGATLYEMVTGRKAFRRPTVQATLEAIQKEDPVPASRLNRKVPRRLQLVIERCLAKNEEARFGSGGELAAAVQRLRTPRRRAVPAMATAVGVTIVLTLVLALVRPTIPDWLRGPVGVGASQRIESVVALPSHVIAGETYFTEAIPNTLSDYLTQVEGLEIRVPPSSVEFEQIDGDLVKIAEFYGVDALLLSTATVQGEDLLLLLRLAEARTRNLLWSQEYEGLLSDYTGLIRRAAEGVREAIRPAAEVQPLAEAAPGSAAELAFRLGMYHSNRFNNFHQEEDFDVAFKALQDALEQEPTLADAAAEIAFLYVFQNEALGTERPAHEALSAMKSWVHRALEIDPRNGRALTARFALRDLEEQLSPGEALALGLAAASAAPQYARAHMGVAFSLETSLVLGMESLRQAARIDPLYPHPKLAAAEMLAGLGRFSEALDLVDLALQLEPGMPHGLGVKAWLLIESGQLQEGLQLLERLEPMVTEERYPPFGFHFMRDMVAVAQAAPDAATALQRLIEGSRNAPYIFLNSVLRLAPWLVRVGRLEAALQVLSDRDATSYIPYDYLRLNPAFESLSGDERFQRIAERRRAQFEQAVSILQYAQTRGELPNYVEQPLSDLLVQLGMS